MYTVKFARAVIAAWETARDLESAIGGHLGDIESISVQGDAIYIETRDEKQHTVLITDHLIALAKNLPSPAPASADKPKRRRRTKAEIAAEEAEKSAPDEPVSAEGRSENGNPVSADDNPPFVKDDIPPVADWPTPVEPEDEGVEPEPAAIEPGAAGINYYLQAEETEDGVWRLILYVEGTHPSVQGRFDSVANALVAARPLREKFAADGWTETKPIKAVNNAF